MKNFRYLALVALLLLPGCTETNKGDGIRYQTYGLLNENKIRMPGIEYQVSVWNVLLAVVFIETVIVWVILYDLYEPVGPLAHNAPDFYAKP